MAARDAASSYGTSATASTATIGAGGELGGIISDKGHRTSPVGGATVMTSSSLSAAATGGSEFIVGSGDRVKSSPHSSREHARLDWIGEGEKGGGGAFVTGPPMPKKREREEGEGREFSVDSLHNHRSSEDAAVRELEEETKELRARLEMVVKENQGLKQDKERVSAQWEGKVRRLRKKLGEHVGEEALEVISDFHPCSTLA